MGWVPVGAGAIAAPAAEAAEAQERGASLAPWTVEGTSGRLGRRLVAMHKHTTNSSGPKNNMTYPGSSGFRAGSDQGLAGV